MESKLIPEMLFSSAQGFYHLGITAALEIEENPKFIQRIVPAMVNMAFATELMLKGLLDINKINFSYTHSFYKLYNALPELDKSIIQTSFDNFKKDDKSKLKLKDFIFSISKGTESKEAKKSNEELGYFLKTHAESFEGWRYMFEYTGNPKTLHANFHLMDSFIRALIAMINLKGYKPVIMSQSKPIY